MYTILSSLEVWDENEINLNAEFCGYIQKIVLYMLAMEKTKISSHP